METGWQWIKRIDDLITSDMITTESMSNNEQNEVQSCSETDDIEKGFSALLNRLETYFSQ